MGLLSQLFDLCTMIVDVECQWVSRNTECYVVMAKLHECGCVHMYTQSHSHYYMLPHSQALPEHEYVSRGEPGILSM